MVKTSPQQRATRTGVKNGYAPPIVVASFRRLELADELPEDIAPHIHSSQSS
ncbi:hypothetical protein [Nocardia gipuzkoensis]